MSTATLTSKGQTTIPKDVRTHLGLEAGDRMEFILAGDAVILRPATRKITDLRGFLPKPAKPVSLDKMDTAVRRRASR
jgi:AbrB family looped-hinge helix DNA binding protein